MFIRYAKDKRVHIGIYTFYFKDTKNVYLQIDWERRNGNGYKMYKNKFIQLFEKKIMRGK